jgi:hypothetical protein
MLNKNQRGFMAAKSKRDEATRKVFSVLLDVSLVKKIKQAGLDNDTSMSDIVEQALKAYLSKVKK